MTENQFPLTKRNDASLDWVKSYSPYIRALLMMVTGASTIAITGNPLLAGMMTGAVEGALELMSSGIDQMRRERDRAFFDELEKDQHLITQELIDREDFLHDFLASLSAARRTRHREKIKRFARLLLTAIQENRLGSSEVEEFRAILEDLSPRELQILLVLQRFEDSHSRQLIESKGSTQLENDLQYAKRFWQEFQSAVESQLGIKPHMLASLLTRLTRTGFYEPITGAYWGYTGGQGLLTARFAEFKQWIELEANED